MNYSNDFYSMIFFFILFHDGLFFFKFHSYLYFLSKLKDKFDKDNIEEDDKDNLSNMALLNASINRSYGNAFFAVKRQFIKENDIDLIISDVVMPEMNGVEFLAQVKKLKPSITLILLTGYADKENAIRAINEVQLYKYIEKPWDNNNLISYINDCIKM